MIPILLLSLSCLALFGCHDKEIRTEPDKETDIEPEPIDGGEIDHSDYSAPKEIVSKDIISYYATFCLEGEWAPGHKNEFLIFEVKRDDQGVLTASEAVTGVSAPADRELLSSLQDIIDKYKLVSKNGEYRITAGIDPYLFGPCALKAEYASGEYLSFTHDNEPSDEWAIKTYLAFAKWFADRGDSSLLPEGYGDMVSDIRFSFNDKVNDHSYDYSIEEERDEYGRLIVKRTVNGKTEKAVVFSTDIFFGSISSIVSDYDPEIFNTSLSEDEAGSGDLKLFIAFEDGHEISVDAGDEDLTENLVLLISDLMDEIDPLFKN